MRFLLPLFGVALAHVALGQPFQIDGHIDTNEWARALKNEGLIDPQTREEAPFGGEFWLASDDTYIYFAARLEDSEPEKIVADEFRPNVGLGGEDTVSLELDIKGQLNEFNGFTINSRGANNISIAGGRAAKTEWLGEILTRGRRTESGWEVEARIPWQIMRLPEPGPRELRFNFSRYLPRTQRNYVWRFTGEGNNNQYGRWPNVQVPKAQTERVIQILPYGVLGVGRNKPVANAGFDFRTRLSDRIEATGSVDPDFRNVEQGILGLNFSYFERFASDNRPFFQEGSEFFNTGFGSRLFSSNRVSNFDFGTRVFGYASDKVRFGAMNLTEFGEQNAAVFSTIYDATPRTNYNFAYTRLDRGAINNDAFFANFGQGVGRWFYYLQGNLSNDSEFGEAARLGSGFSYNERGVSVGMDYNAVEARYRPRLGNSVERDVRSIGGYAFFDQIHPRGQVMETEYGVYWDKAWRMDGDRYRQSIGFNTSATFRNAFDLDFGGEIGRFEDFDDQTLNISLEWPRRARTRSWEVGSVWGHLSGKRYVRHSLGTRLKPLRTMNLNLSAQFEEHFENRTLWIATYSWDLGQNYFVGGRAVRSGKDYNAYASLSRTGTLGNEYTLILGDPNARSFRWGLAIKGTFPLSIRY